MKNWKATTDPTDKQAIRVFRQPLLCSKEKLFWRIHKIKGKHP